MFVARDESSALYLFEKMPHRGNIYNKFDWLSDGSGLVQINKELFPNLSWNDEPLEIEIRQVDNTLILSDNSAMQINHVWAMYAALQQETAKLREENAYLKAKFASIKSIILK